MLRLGCCLSPPHQSLWLCAWSEYIQPKQERSRSQKFQTPYTSGSCTLLVDASFGKTKLVENTILQQASFKENHQGMKYKVFFVKNPNGSGTRVTLRNVVTQLGSRFSQNMTRLESQSMTRDSSQSHFFKSFEPLMDKPSSFAHKEMSTFFFSDDEDWCKFSVLTVWSCYSTFQR